MSNTALQGLQDLLLSALDELSVMISAPEAEMNTEQNTQSCQLHFENLNMAASMAEMPGLQILFEFYQPVLQQACESSKLDSVLEWLFAVSNYLQNASEENIVTLLAPFDADQSDILLAQLSEDLEQQNASQSDSDDDMLSFDDECDDECDDEFSADAYKTVDIINMFLEEFVDVSDQMQQLIDTIIADDSTLQASQQALLAYQELLDRIILTTDTLNLEGLGNVCKFVKRNIFLLSALDTLDGEDMARIKAVLSGWNQNVIDYLKMPEDDSACIALVSYLESSSWPEPLAYQQSQDILVTLIEGLTGLEPSEGGTGFNRSTTASADDVALTISDDASAALIDAFFQESPTLAAEFTGLVSQIANGNNVQSNTNSAQRLAHTLKGSANLIGARGIANLTHHIEDILEYFAKTGSQPPAQLADTLQQAADTIEIMIEALQGQSEAPDDALSLLQTILDWANRIDQGDISSETVIETNTVTPETDAATDATSTLSKAITESLQVPVNTVDQMFRLVGEMSIAMGQMQEQIKSLMNEGEDLNQQDIVVQQKRFELENLIDIKNVSSRQRRLRHAGVKNAHFDSLEMDEYDEVHGAVHSYIESVADSRTIGRELGLKSHVLDGLLAQQKQLYSELQSIIMGTRMVPVESIVARLQRSVRQACRATGKQAELVISGSDLQIDGDVLKQLTAPLMHLLRNAIDHGIEEAEDRELLGKPAAGQIRLDFEQKGNHVVVNCSDDGRGLDLDKIRSTAEANGLVAFGKPLSDNEIARLILQPGFTTRSSATQISGRGVGMDVVNTAISQLKGLLNIKQDVATGTMFEMSLPITLVTNHSVIASVEGEDYAIPTSVLTQILTPGIGEFGKVGDTMTYQLKDEIYPARHLKHLYGIPSLANNDDLSRKYTLLVRTSSGVTAVIVDTVINSYDLVVKDTGRYVKSVHGISGISVLGNGDVIPVLDLVAQLGNQQFENMGNSQSQTAAIEAVQVPRVLIVDDSLSVRQSLSQLIEDAGYEVMQARDGLEAMDMIREQAPDIVLADMEMPRMNGLELTTAIRNLEETRNLPVIMITSRSMQKHRDEATRAGVSNYMTKPFVEDQLLSNINSYIAAA